MTALLTDNLPLLAGAPNGIKKLRELILELAVRGKLVPQDPSDEPACELLKRIAEEKARLLVEGKIKKQKTRTEIAEEEKPFAIPTHWEWVRLESLLKKIGAGSTPLGGKQAYVADGVKFLRSQNVWNEGLRLNDVAFIPEETHQKMSGTHVEAGDLLFNITGASIGRCAEVPFDFDTGNVSQHVTIIRPVSSDAQPFLHVVLVSQLVQQAVMDVQVGVSREGLSIGKLSQFLIPFPPEAEQHRIVAKVDELMALCDRLEAQQADAESAHTQLVQALLDSLTQASDVTDFAANWQRLAEHFHTLFTTEPSIDALKQTLLQLAVMGKLVPQESSDEPASELLKRIAEEKGQLVSKGKIRKQKPLGEITEEEKTYELPAAWAWTRLGSQVLESGAGWSPSCEARPRDGDEWGVLKVSAVSWGIYRPEENKALPPNLEARPEHEVAKGDFLVSRANTAELVARSVVAEETPKRLMLSDKLVRLKLTSMCVRRYMNLANSAPLARCYYSQVAGGTSSSMKNVSREQILNLPIALPPLAEQHRIVAKFDSLMAICDTLKRQINAATEKQIALLNVFMAKI
ncbi:restriction endonuclease subunit S [Pseudomonas chlororaphis]|uniref:restriction endonuclease subunit S n=1 Tax=Pseudomonas chlororaphis TaxID=587753 RepID=UPI002D76A826|nr:restriction endonuclease subunit S [Pseudomonas chlororaphis]